MQTLAEIISSFNRINRWRNLQFWSTADLKPWITSARIQMITRMMMNFLKNQPGRTLPLMRITDQAASNSTSKAANPHIFKALCNLGGNSDVPEEELRGSDCIYPSSNFKIAAIALMQHFSSLSLFSCCCLPRAVGVFFCFLLLWAWPFWCEFPSYIICQIIQSLLNFFKKKVPVSISLMGTKLVLKVDGFHAFGLSQISPYRWNHESWPHHLNGHFAM